jgi:serine protease Do
MKEKRSVAKYVSVFVVLGALLGAGLQTAAASKTSTEPAPQRVPGTVRMVPESFSDLAERARPGVVNIRTVRTLKGGGPVFRHFFGNPFGESNPFEEYFRGFPDKQPRPDFKQQSLGSGFIIDKEGHIVTNNHVIEGADQIKVRTASGEEFDGQIVGRDQKTDLALLKIDGSDDLAPLQFGDSEALRVGTWVLAIGSPFGLEQTVTSGIVSAKGRVIGAGPYDDFIQTDASINPGNSGGPLLNMSGDVVGINTAIISRGGGNDGIGFAIPVNLAKGIISQLKDKGAVTRAWLGVGIQDITPELADYYQIGKSGGVLVTQVYAGDPAEKAGIKTGDVILSVDGKKVSSGRELSRTIASAQIGKRIPISVIRGGENQTLYVELVERADSERVVSTASRSAHGLGLSVEQISPEKARRFGHDTNETGVVVTALKPDGKGATAGIQPGDLIKEINRERVNTVKDYEGQVAKANAGDTLQLLIKRAQSGLMVVNVTV